MEFAELMESLQKVFEVILDVSKWLNSNIFSNIGSVVDIFEKVVDFFTGLFEGDALGGIGDFFGGLFG